MSKEELNVFNIPANFADGIVIAGKMIPIRYFIQALITAAIPTALVFKFYDPDSLTTRISVCLSVFVPVFVFCAFGILGNGILDFLTIMLRFMKRRRECFYNPRIKHEEQFSFPERQQGSVIPGKRIAGLLKGRTAQRDEGYRNDALFFEEDALVSGTPIEYMGFFQYLRYTLSLSARSSLPRVHEPH